MDVSFFPVQSPSEPIKLPEPSDPSFSYTAWPLSSSSIYASLKSGGFSPLIKFPNQQVHLKTWTEVMKQVPGSWDSHIRAFWDAKLRGSEAREYLPVLRLVETC